MVPVSYRAPRPHYAPGDLAIFLGGRGGETLPLTPRRGYEVLACEAHGEYAGFVTVSADNGVSHTVSPSLFQRAPLTPAQTRVLEFCRVHGRWVSLTELEMTILLKPDDVVVVPSLVQAGLLEHCFAAGIVRVTAQPVPCVALLVLG